MGVGPSSKAKLFTILSPVGPYYKTGFAPVSLLADDRYARAWAGGVGNYKVGGYVLHAYIYVYMHFCMCVCIYVCLHKCMRTMLILRNRLMF